MFHCQIEMTLRACLDCAQGRSNTALAKKEDRKEKEKEKQYPPKHPENSVVMFACRPVLYSRSSCLWSLCLESEMGLLYCLVWAFLLTELLCVVKVSWLAVQLLNIGRSADERVCSANACYAVLTVLQLPLTLYRKCSAFVATIPSTYISYLLQCLSKRLFSCKYFKIVFNFWQGLCKFILCQASLSSLSSSESWLWNFLRFKVECTCVVTIFFSLSANWLCVPWLELSAVH